MSSLLYYERIFHDFKKLQDERNKLIVENTKMQKQQRDLHKKLYNNSMRITAINETIFKKIGDA